MVKSKVFFYCLIGFIGGIAGRSFFALPVFYIYILFFVGIVILLITIIAGRRSGGKGLVFGLMIIFLAIGVGRFELGEWLRAKDADKRIESYNEQTVDFIAVVADEPDARTDHQKLTLGTRALWLGTEEVEVKGKVLAKVGLYPQYEYGDELLVNCKLRTPEPIEDFAYDKYLARYNVYSLCYSPRIKKLGSDQGDWLKDQLYSFKAYFSQKIAVVLKEPYAAFMGGLLLGAKKGMPPDLVEVFNKAGITHIVAISGYNITILAVIFSAMALRMGISRKRSFWLILIGVGFFVFITGAPASIVRAAIMGMIVLLAKKIGRPSQARNVIVLSGALMALVNPKVLVFDGGFQLSFVSTLGLIYISPLLTRLFRFLPEAFTLRESASSTVAATIATLPLIIFLFGRLSIVAVIVNMLVLPFIPLSMLVGFITGVGAMIWLPLGEVLGWVSWLVLHYIILVAEFFGGLSWASVDMPQVEGWVMVAGYVGLVFAVAIVKQFISEKR